MKWIQGRMGWGKKDIVYQPEPDEADWENVEVEEGHEVQAIYKETLSTYSLQVSVDVKFNPEEERPPVHQATEQDKRVLADLPAIIEMMEDAVQDLLPEGYSVRITYWNQ
jgi:hypothetical protein